MQVYLTVLHKTTYIRTTLSPKEQPCWLISGRTLKRIVPSIHAYDDLPLRRAIAHDSEMYPNPSVFDPERFLGVEAQTDPRKFVFGFGRRVSVHNCVLTSCLLLQLTKFVSG